MLALVLGQVLNGAIIGAMYGIIALGITLTFGITGIVNFALGEFMMIGAYATFALAEHPRRNIRRAPRRNRDDQLDRPGRILGGRGCTEQRHAGGGKPNKIFPHGSPALAEPIQYQTPAGQTRTCTL